MGPIGAIKICHNRELWSTSRADQKARRRFTVFFFAKVGKLELEAQKLKNKTPLSKQKPLSLLYFYGRFDGGSRKSFQGLVPIIYF